jgi:hypothetical protein
MRSSELACAFTSSLTIRALAFRPCRPEVEIRTGGKIDVFADLYKGAGSQWRAGGMLNSAADETQAAIELCR